ncbi:MULTISPECIES: hypothetical protein [unclassified Microcoleus]|uniref:hypothetical protein n=1 Tax=unclassified Microcoleus TaxID=2642155 RepID=UPI002FD02418
MVISIADSLPINNILFMIYPLGHLGIALIEWVLLGWGILLWRLSPSLAMIVLPLLLASLSYDNFILSVGNLIGEGELLEILSRVRFLLHDLIVPLFIVIGVELAHRAGAAWATTIVRVLSWVVAFGLAGIDITTNYIGLELEPRFFAEILRYSPANLTGPPIITIVVNLFMLLIGIGIWVRLKWSWLFVGTFIALLGNAMPSSTVGTLPGSASELVMALSLLLTEDKVQIIGKKLARNQQQENIFMVNKNPEAAFEWEHIIPKDGYKIYQSGSHIKGNFIQVFAPDAPCRDGEGKLRLITYLHGFALCLPKFYESHLEELAKQGYYVVFPDFQNSRYPDDITTNKASEEKEPLSFWLNILSKVVSKWDKFKIEDTLLQYRRKKIGPVVRKLLKPTLFKYLRLSLALVVLFLVIKLFKNRYGKNLKQLIYTVDLSLLHSPVEWIQQAIGLTDAAWKKLGQDNPSLAQSEFDFYVFGHSLGGLLAMSWPLYIEENQQKFLPKQILTAAPAPSTDMGIPQIAIWILKIFNSPFTAKPINIRQIGSRLILPIGILHGADDKIVKPGFWIDRAFGQKTSNFDCIASHTKKIYFSLSNKESNPPLIAFHNQAVTDTTYFDDALFAKLGGVKKQPNIYNSQYIWRGFDLVVTNQADVNELLDKFNQPGSLIEVTDTLPEKSIDFTKIAIALLVGLTFLGLGYWFWQYYTPV